MTGLSPRKSTTGRFFHLFIRQTFIEYLPSARPGERHFCKQPLLSGLWMSLVISTPANPMVSPSHPTAPLSAFSLFLSSKAFFSRLLQLSTLPLSSSPWPCLGCIICCLLFFLITLAPSFFSIYILILSDLLCSCGLQPSRC